MFKQLFFLILASAILFVSCNRGDEPDVESGPTDNQVESSVNSQMVFDDALLIADESMDEAGVNKTATVCADFTLDTTARTLLIDFGTGCTSNSGITRSGTIQVNYLGRHRQPGSQFTLTLNNYTVNGTSVSGTLSLTSLSLNAQGKLTYSYAVTNATVVYQSASYTYSSQRTVTWDSGFGNGNTADDVFLISGSSSGSNGTDSYTATITTPVRIDLACAATSGIVPTAGAMSIQQSGLLFPYVIDFGTGTCDRDLTVTFRSVVRTVSL